MNHTLALIVTGILSAAVLPASAQSQLARCERPLSTAGFVLEEVGRCYDALQKADNPGAQPVAGSTGPIVAEVVIAAGTLPPDILALDFRKEVDDLLRWFVYSAFVSGDESKCNGARLLQVPPKDRFISDCVNEKRILDLQKSWFGPAGGLAAACRRLEDREVKMSPECCDFLSKNRDNPAICGKLSPRCIRDAGTCQGLVRSMSGIGHCKKGQMGEGGSSCKTQAECEEEHERCMGDVAYGIAMKTKDPARCGGNERCRLLMGEGAKVLQEMGRRLSRTPSGKYFVGGDWARTSRRKVIAPQGAPPPPVQAVPSATLKSNLPGFTCQLPLGTTANRKLADDMFALADSCLTTLETVLKPSDAARLVEIDQEREKLIRTRAKLSRYFDPPAARAPSKGKN